MNLIRCSVVALLATFPLVTLAAAPRPTIVLVHGAFETADVWGHVAAKLEHDGYAVKNVNLPGRRGNEMQIADVSLAAYQQAVAKTIASETKPVVLVGHSFAGFTISAEAEAEPAKIKTLVFVAAYIPQNGQSLLSVATTDSDSKLGPILKIDKEKGYASVDPSGGAAVFANDAPKTIQDIVASAIVSEPLAPLGTPVGLTPGNFGSVDKVAIHTLRDEVVSPALQDQMEKATPIRLRLTIDTGHTPFITRPDALAADIERAAKKHP